jgi:hypothetical protein
MAHSDLSALMRLKKTEAQQRRYTRKADEAKLVINANK